MSFFSNLFGSKTEEKPAQPPSPTDEVRRQIEEAEGELHETEEQLSTATNEEIRNSLALIVERKKQALKDLQEKLALLSKT